MNSRNELLKKVFDKLNENGILYVCMGEPFYDSDASEGDIDLRIADDDIGAASSILDTIFSNEAQLTYFSNWNLDFA